MRIEIVQLENIRSHVKSTVPFARGFNCLVGGLGCGKSSILYSIDFALFGDPIGRAFDYLLREDATVGRVIVQFTQNGKSYRIFRALKRHGKGISQDFNELKLFVGEDLISSTKNDAVAEQLKAITGLDRDLFREIIWVRQEHLKEFLNLQPRERQRRLDELFGLSDYETAWSNLAGYVREYGGEKKAYEKDPDVAGMEKLGEEYDRTAVEFSRVEIELQDVAKKLVSTKKVLEEADLKLRELEEVRAQNEELRRKEAKIHANLTSMQEANASLVEEVEGKRGRIENLQRRLNAMGKQLESFNSELKELGISNDQPIESLRRQIATFDDQISSLKGGQEATLRNLQADEKRLSSLSSENRCPLCMQTLDEAYKEGLTQRIVEENEGRKRRVNQLRGSIEELQQLKAKVSTVFSNMQILAPRIEDLKLRLREENDALSEILGELEKKQKLESELRVQVEVVRQELNRFDISSLETAKTRREQAFRQYYLLESDLHAKENRKKDLTKHLDEMKERIDNGQQKIERMKKIEKVIEIIEGIRSAYRSIQPKLRTEFVKVLRGFVQQVLDSLAGEEGPLLNLSIDETYTPYVISEGNVEREVSNLSGGERTMLAFAYRLGLGQLIMQSRTGHGLTLLLLDEPTESLGTEDGSVHRLAEAISRFKAIEQTIAVTHSDAFAEKAEHVIRLEKELGQSKISVEK
ncbi:MAG: AAA family ATPase [Candidatus Bathyarchaeia archaeon]|jgi:exonuclease SbcC